VGKITQPRVFPNLRDLLDARPPPLHDLTVEPSVGSTADGQEGEVMSNTMRTIRMLAAAAALVLVLGGIGARHAGAQSRDEMKNEVNDFVSWCFSVGGDEEMAAKCLMCNGDVYECAWATWLDSRQCSLHGQYDPNDSGIAPPLTRSKDTHGPTGGGTTLASDDGSGSAITNQGNGAGTALTTKGAGSPAAGSPTPSAGG
jgi:hypothetical protein